MTSKSIFAIAARLAARSLLGVLLCVVFASCRHTASPRPPVAKVTPAPSAPEPPPQPVLYEWHGDGMTGKTEVKIDLSEQKAYITRGGQPAGWTYVATGKSGYSTPPGSYRIIEKVKDKHSNLWGQVVDAEGNVVVMDARAGRDRVPKGGRFVGAPMPYWMRLKGGIGMHAGYLPDPGSPASHGCIRLPKEMAEILFDIAPLGTPVKVVP